MPRPWHVSPAATETHLLCQNAPIAKSNDARVKTQKVGAELVKRPAGLLQNCGSVLQCVFVTGKCSALLAHFEGGSLNCLEHPCAGLAGAKPLKFGIEYELRRRCASCEKQRRHEQGSAANERRMRVS